MMDIRPIRTEDDLTWALAEVEAYFVNQPKPGTPEADRFDVLSTLIEAYEDKHWPIEAADPVEVVAAVMEQRDLTQATLSMLLQSRSRASELLGRKREITKDQAWILHTSWGIPAELLIAPYSTREDALAGARQPARRYRVVAAETLAPRKPSPAKAAPKKAASKKAAPVKKAAPARKPAAKKPAVRRAARPSAATKRPTVHG